MSLSDISSYGDMMPLAACDILSRDEAGLQQIEEQGGKAEEQGGKALIFTWGSNCGRRESILGFSHHLQNILYQI